MGKGDYYRIVKNLLEQERRRWRGRLESDPSGISTPAIAAAVFHGGPEGTVSDTVPPVGGGGEESPPPPPPPPPIFDHGAGARFDAFPVIEVDLVVGGSTTLLDTLDNDDSDQLAQQMAFPVFHVDAPNFTLSTFTTPRGTWGIDGSGRLLNNLLGPAPPPTPRSVANYIGFTSYTDLRATARMDAGFARFRFILARWNQAANSGYVLSLQNGASILIQRVDAGVATTIATTGVAFTSTDDVAIQCVGTTISSYLNGVLLASVVDATYTIGAVGLGADAPVGAFFSKLYIDPPS